MKAINSKLQSGNLIVLNPVIYCAAIFQSYFVYGRLFHLQDEKGGRREGRGEGRGVGKRVVEEQGEG